MRPTPGDALDSRLIELAERLLEAEGVEALTLRRLAREAGVSHSAPLRHFRSVADLLAEVAARGFRLLQEAVEKASSSLPPGAGAEARLREAGRGYIEAAVAHPGHFALMFRPELLDARNEAFVRESGAAFEGLVQHVRAAQDAGWKPGHDTRLLAGCVWSAVHGLATLWAQGAFSGAVPGATLEQTISTTLDLVLEKSPDGAA